jgi:hypothetical protein
LNPDEALNGRTTFITIWDMVSGIPNSIIAQTEVVTINGISQTYTANISNGAFSLSPGQYLVAIEEESDISITIATTTDKFTPGKTWVKFPITSTTWNHNEYFDHNSSYILRPNLQNSSLSIQENQFGNNDITFYPNPSSKFITISGINKNENYKIYNVLGVEINSGIISNNEKIDIQNFNNGIFFLKFKNGKTIKFMKK